MDAKLHVLDDASTKVTVFRKPTHTDQYLNFDSHHPLEQKRSVVRSLFNRANIITDKKDRDAEISHCKRALEANGYEPWIFSSLNNTKKKTEPQQRDPTARRTQVGLPYVKGVSERLQRTFRKHGLGVYHKPTNSIRSMLVRPKDKTPPLSQCGVIYEIDCADCSSTYIGETARPLATRLKEHQKSTQSAVAEHTSKTSHNIDWDSVQVIDKEQYTIPRKIREAIHIRQRRPAMNRDSGWDLPPLYDHLLSPDRTTPRSGDVTSSLPHTA